MAKYFSNLEVMNRAPYLGPPCDFMFSLINSPLIIPVANSIRRASMSDIKTYSICPDTIKIEENTTCWDSDLIIQQLVYIILNPHGLKNTDINMIEFTIKLEGSDVMHTYVFANSIVIKNKENGEILKNEEILVYLQQPLFSIGYKDKVHIIFTAEKMSKTEAINKGGELSARHQASTIGIDYVLDDENPDVDPETILATVNNQTGYNSKELIEEGIRVLIEDVQSMYNSIENNDEDNFYIKINKNERYDIVFYGKTHTVGNLIERWINRNDINAFIGYRESQDKKSLLFDYTLFKNIPANTLLFNDKLKNEISTYINNSLDNNSEKKQVIIKQTLESFKIHIKRVVEHLTELLEDWKLTTIVNLTVEEYKNKIFELRKKRML